MWEQLLFGGTKFNQLLFLWERFDFVGSKGEVAYVFCGNNANCVYMILKCVPLNQYIIVYMLRIHLDTLEGKIVTMEGHS